MKATPAAAAPGEPAPTGRGSGPASAWVLLAATLAGMVALLALEATDVDRVIEGQFFDSVTGTFPLRNNAFLKVVLHYWTTYLVALIDCLAFAGFLLTFLVPAFRAQRRMLLFVALAIALSTATVSSLKLVSVKHCPWDLAIYGGVVSYTRLLDRASPAAGPGHCFPAGHAAAGFSLLTFYFVGRARREPRLARAGLALGLAAGTALGLGRMLQGAHFLSHVLWSGVVCWLVILALYIAFFGYDARVRS